MRYIRLIKKLIANRPSIITGDKGFTLIELLTTTSIIGILAGISIQSFAVYRDNAEYSRAQSTLRHGETAVQAALVVPDISLPAVAMMSQAVPGEFADADARQIVPGLVIPKNVRVHLYNDPACDNGACIAQFMQVNPCNGTKYANWTRMGDGEELYVGQIPGVGCP